MPLATNHLKISHLPHVECNFYKVYETDIMYTIYSAGHDKIPTIKALCIY